VLRRRRRETANPLRWALAFGVGALPLAVSACTQSSGLAATGNQSPVTIDTRHTALGSIITDGNGFSVYLFEKDMGTSSTCYGSCTTQWVPVTTVGTPRVTGRAQASLLGTSTRRGGSIQVTYAGHPLYRYIGDHKPGDVTGEGLQTFGGGWDLISPSGDKVEKGG
jgi:predicted lipoprotein with Yx(FWY)xxD motif